MKDRPLVIRLLDFYAENNFTVLRTWAFWDGDESQALQTGPGKTPASEFTLSKKLDQEFTMRRRSVRLTLSSMKLLCAVSDFIWFSRITGLSLEECNIVFISDFWCRKQLCSIPTLSHYLFYEVSWRVWVHVTLFLRCLESHWSKGKYHSTLYDHLA